jgi:transcriptional regulator with XRE-family HTH domain
MIGLNARVNYRSRTRSRPYTRARVRNRLPPRPKNPAVSRREIGARLRSLRAEQDYSQARLAKILGTHQTNVSEMERGVRGITIHQLVRLSKALKVSPNDILMGAGKENGHAPLPARFVRRLRAVATLPPAEQKALLKIIDSVIQAHRK